MNMIEVNGTKISYVEEGNGRTVLLIHGFASNANANWVNPGWFKTLTEVGYRVVAIDNRGHGNSTKFYDEDDYTLEAMADDVAGLIDTLDLDRPHVMGYSMGCRITATLAAKRGDRLGKLVFAGNGYNMIEGGFDTGLVRNALLADSLEETVPGVGRNFRVFAEKTGNDLKALAACIRGRTIDQSVFERIVNETLIIIGEEDDIAIGGDRLAEIMPNATFAGVPRRNHMNVVGDKVYKQKVVEFLAG